LSIIILHTNTNRSWKIICELIKFFNHKYFLWIHILTSKMIQSIWFERNLIFNHNNIISNLFFKANPFHFCVKLIWLLWYFKSLSSNTFKIGKLEWAFDYDEIHHSLAYFCWLDFVLRFEWKNAHDSFKKWMIWLFSNLYYYYFYFINNFIVLHSLQFFHRN
jgi:hypothetical protein